MDFFDEINNLDYLFLVVIKDLPANRLSITVKAATVSDRDEDLVIANKNIGPVRSITAKGPGQKYELHFETYGAYQVTNESFSVFNENDERIGRLFCIYSKSTYINYVRENTIVNYTYDYDNALKHYSLNCQHHTIDIITKEEPVIKRL